MQDIPLDEAGMRWTLCNWDGNIPDESKGKHSASCNSGVGWDWRGVKRKGSLGIENERDVI